jgi:hypothetical protein
MRCAHDAGMKTIRIIAMVMLAFLYLGGMVGHLAGAAFPIIGSGHKAVGHFEGRTSDPVRPTITDCRHIPLVKTVLVPLQPVLAQPAYEQTAEFLIVEYPAVFQSLHAVCLDSHNGRAPPRS